MLQAGSASRQVSSLPPDVCQKHPHQAPHRLWYGVRQALLSRINAAQRTASGLLTVSPARGAPGGDGPLTPGGPFRDGLAHSAFSPVAGGSFGGPFGGGGPAFGGGASVSSHSGGSALPPRGGPKALGGAARLAVVAMASAGGVRGDGGDAEREGGVATSAFAC